MFEVYFKKIKQFLRSKKTIFLTTGALALLMLALYFPDYAKLQKLRRENIRTGQKIERLKKDIDILKSNMRRLKEDSFFWEDIARKELGVVREGTTAVDIKN